MSDSQNRFGDLPVHPASWDPASLEFPEGADFESSVEEWIGRGELEDPVDEMMAGHPSPRVWLLLHEPGQGALSATAALALARELGSRDQGVLILDCDEADSTLTRWAGRDGAEGWADLVRYGASVLTCGLRLPFTGRQGYLLGPGSYVPVDVLAEEIQQIIARLRRQADDIVLVCPSGDTGRRWAPAASIRLLCRDAGVTAPGRADEIVHAFAEADLPLTGMVRFGAEQPEAAFAEAADEPRSDPETGDELPEPDAAFGFDADPESAGPETPGPDEGGEENEEEDDPAAAALAALDEQEETSEPAARPGPDAFARKRGTSRVFWWVALGAIALISLSVWYYREYVIAPLPSPSTDRPVEIARGDDGPTADVSVDESAASGGETVTDEPGETADTPAGDDSATGDQAPVGTDVTRDDGGDQAADEGSAEPTVADGTPSQMAGQSAGQTAGQTGEPAAEQTVERTEEQPEEQPAAADPEPAAAEEIEGFQMDPYLVPVGEDGWALHIYSFPDEESANQEIALLERKGFRTETRVVEIKGKGRWHRIYLGSFANKADAQAALPLLLEELREDWGRPTQF